MTARVDIFVEVDARLEQVPGVAEYDRMPAGDPTRYPALQAFDEGDELLEGETAASRLGLVLTVQGFVTGKAGAGFGRETHNSLLQMHADTVFALCGDAGGNLGGLVEGIEPVGKRRTDVAELSKERRLAFAQDFLITFATKRGNPNEFA